MTTPSPSANDFREQGNQAFKEEHFQEAIDRYTDALKALELADANKSDFTKCYSNRAQCYINLGQYYDAVEDTTRGRASSGDQ